MTVVRIGGLAIFCLALLACSPARAASAAPANNCPGHPDAIGTSRTLVVDPRAHPRIGSMQYPETLPLRDHEVVLTFDDGPVPRNSNKVLQILADQCVKATFFTIGEQAQASPEGVRKLVAADHTVGTHSQHHPLTFHKMSEEQAKKEIDDGIASVKAAMTDPSALAPFFRIPGLLRAYPVEDYLESQGIQTWSADVVADDWHRISSAKVHDLAIKRLDAIGKGILLLHDIHARTADALPGILRDLKARGYKIVHVVPATPDRPATPTEPEQWLLHPPSENVAISRWPKLPNFVYADADMLPAPAASDFNLSQADVLLSMNVADRERRRGVPLPKEAPWPRPEALPVVATIAASLPMPAASVFELPEQARAAIQPFPLHLHHFDEPAVTEESAAPVRVAIGPHGRHGRGARQGGVHQVRRVAHAALGTSRQLARPAGAKRSVHVASLKKRKI